MINQIYGGKKGEDDGNLLERVQHEATGRIQGLEPLCCEDRGELGWFSLERRRLQGHLSVVCQCLEGPVG